MPCFWGQRIGNCADKTTWETKRLAPTGPCPFTVGAKDWLKCTIHQSQSSECTGKMESMWLKEHARMVNNCSCTSGVIFYVNYVICWKLRTLHRILFVESCSLAWIMWIHKHWMKGGKNGYKFCDCKSMLKTIACERAVRTTYDQDYSNIYFSFHLWYVVKGARSNVMKTIFNSCCASSDNS